MDFRSYVAELGSVAATIGVDLSDICHRLTARVEDDERRRGPVSQEEWDGMAEDVAVLKSVLGEAERAVLQIYSSLHRQLWDSEV